MRGQFPRDILLKHAWSLADLDTLIITYISRGSPNDEGRMSGSDIERIGRSFVLLLDGTMIPFHRLIKID